MRLIDADALKTALKSNCKPELCHDYNTAWCESCCRTNEFEDLIDNAPTVAEIFKSGSAVAVRPQGEWLKVICAYDGIKVGVCSQCGIRRVTDNFCGNCGARMKGGAE